MTKIIKVSKKIYNTNWNKLKLLNESSPNWDKGILIVEDRFQSRFFKHIDLVEKDGYSGFVVMSLCCLLVETLMQFYTGYNSTEENPYYKGNQWKAFKDFLKNSPHFNSDFDTNKKCKVFYQQFRCGLLHQAQTKNKSKIWIDTGELVQLSDSKVEDGLIIDRRMFYCKLKMEFADYLNKLSENKNNFRGENLRDNCIVKMNKICSQV